MRGIIRLATVAVIALQLLYVKNAKCDDRALKGPSAVTDPDHSSPVGSLDDSAKGKSADSGYAARKSDDHQGGRAPDTLDGNFKENSSAPATGVQRRLAGSSSTNGTAKRDSQLLSLLAARRRQLLTERLGSHLATIATIGQRPTKHNITNVQLEIRDLNNTFIKKLSIPENNGTSGENRFKVAWESRPAIPKAQFRSEPNLSKLTVQPQDSKSVESKLSLSAKSLQDAKTIRAGYLNNRRKLASEVVRFGHGTRKPLIDLSVVSHETLGIPENKKDSNGNSSSKDASKDEVDAIYDPDEEFQVDESNHGLYLLNYSSNTTEPHNPNNTVVTAITDPEALNIPIVVNQFHLDINTSNKNYSQGNSLDLTTTKNSTVLKNDSLIQNVPENRSVIINKEEISTTSKPVKVEPPHNKESDNNTLFLTDELYNHFRPLESELPDEDMAPFLNFGQKITIAMPSDNVTNVQLNPTKPTFYSRTPEKKRGSYRPVTEKMKNIEEENEEEINENMDVSVVKNVIEKNKIRNTIKMLAPSRQVNLANAYRKQTVNNSITTTTSTESSILSSIPVILAEEESKEIIVKIKDNIANKTILPSLRNNSNRTNYNFRRKPAKLIQQSNVVTEKETITSVTTTTPLPSTVVYTAVVTSVSVTSSIKGQNQNDSKNDTISAADTILSDIVNNSTTKQIVNTTNTEDTRVTNSPIIRNSTANNLNTAENSKKNESTTYRYRGRQRVSTIRPRIKLTTQNKFNPETSTQASPTPFILFSNRSTYYPLSREMEKSLQIPHVTQENHKYPPSTTTEKAIISKTNINLADKVTQPTINIRKTFTSNTRYTDSSTEVVTKKNTFKNNCNEYGKNTSACNTNIATSSISPTTLQDQFITDVTETNIYKIKDIFSKSPSFDNSDENNSYFYVSDATPNTDNVTVRIASTVYKNVGETKKAEGIANVSTPAYIYPNTSNVKKDPKEVLQRRNGEVLIEMEKTNMTTYVLAGLGFLPLTIIIMFVLRHVFLKKTKDIDTDYEGYFQDSEIKKESQVTTVAKGPLVPPKKPDQKWEFPRSKLRLQTLLGQGNFGQVWKAEADDLTGHDGLTRLVAVKTIKETATQKEKQELLHEICIMQKIGTHPNVVTLLACCTEQEPYLLIMEYVMCGKLLTYLRDRRSRLDRFQMPRGGLTSRDLTVFAYCVARGMDYLASKGIVHRDLAARNVLVDHNKLCKIADFGMSRELTPSTSNNDEKCCKPQRNALPVRWMAPEALLYSVYSHETDVWAYGVLLWEIVTLGSTPYATMSGREVLHMVTEGYRLERPAHCKPHLYEAMHACWHTDPAQRPPFSEIKRQLSELLENEPTEGNYVDLESFYQDSSVYSDPSAIIENDGGISIEYSGELSPKLRNDELPRRSFHVSANNLTRNFSAGNLARSANLRSETFSNARGGSHTTVGGFGIMDGGFSGRDGNFCERNVVDKLSGASFHREREVNNSRENGHPGNSLVSRNSFNGIGNPNRSGGRAFISKSGSSRSKRISEFECDI